MRIALLGPLEAYDENGAPIEVGGARLRMLLARLALDPGRPVPARVLIDDLWGAEGPADAANALQAQASRLRRALNGAASVDSVAEGYRLSIGAEDVDALRFEELAVRGRRDLAAADLERASARLGEALGLWRGAALDDLLEAPYAQAVATRLEDLRIAAMEDRFDAELRLGRHAEVAVDLDAASARHPLRERLAALRMRALYAAGRRAEALGVYESIRARLADELGVDPSHELRETHVALLRGELDTPRPSRPAPGRLPAGTTSFVGRDSEMAWLAALLRTSRLITMVGSGGVGKTRLAVETVARQDSAGRGGAWFVPLGGVASEAVPEATTGSTTGPTTGTNPVTDAVLGVLSTADRRNADSRPDSSAQISPVDRVLGLLGGGDAVLILDNCEHVLAAAAAFCHDVLGRADRLRILATSREPLAITEETLFPLHPLAMPDDPPRLEAAEVPSVRLFADRAAAVRPGFVVDASTVGPVVEICRRLDGLPLALELAAARLRSMSLEQIAERLDERFRLLTSGSRVAEPRQRTLRAVVEWSWDLLTEPERALARRLSVFPGGATSAGLEAVAADGMVPPRDVVYVVGSLVEKSLVEKVDGDEPRYRMLETVRAFAAEELDAAGEQEATVTRFERHYVALAEEQEPRMRSAEQASAVRILEAESGNLVYALRSVIDRADADATARLLAPLAWYWNTLRYDARADTFVAMALRLGDGLPVPARAAFTVLDLLSGGVPADPESVRSAIDDCVRTGAFRRYPVLLVSALPMAYLSGLDDLVEREIQRARNGPDAWARACTFIVETFVHYDRGEWTTIAGVLTEAVREFESTGDRLWTAMALAGLARTDSVGGDHSGAIAAYERSIALVSDLGSENETAASYRLGLATERMRAGDLAGARRELDIVEQMARNGSPYLLEVDVRMSVAELHRRSGELARSEQALERVEALARETPFSSAAIDERVASARLANRLAAGDVDGARRLVRKAIDAAFVVQDIAPAAQWLARLRLLEGDPAEAAFLLGMSTVIRGAFDRGDPDLGDLVAALVEHLGEPAYDLAYGRGAAIPRPEALERLRSAA